MLTVPYWVGLALGLRQVIKLTRKYHRIHAIVAKQQGHSFFLCFFLRAVSCLPGDIVTLYLGATRTPFWLNLLGGTLGILPGMVLATLMGSSIQDPSSPAFWLSAALSVGLAASSALLYAVYWKHHREDGDDP